MTNRDNKLSERIRRLQMSELVERILSEARIADRPGSLERLETIAADVAALERENARLRNTIDEAKEEALWIDIPMAPKRKGGW